MDDNAVMVACISSVLTGAVVFYYVVCLFGGVASSSKKIRGNSNVFRDKQGELSVCDLRKESRFFYYGESLIREIAGMFDDSPLCGVVRHSLYILNDKRCEVPSLWIGLQVAQSITFGMLALPICCFFLNPFLSLALSVVLGLGVFFITVESLKSEAKKAKEQIKRRLPFVVDLMALTLKAGAQIGESLQIAAEENKDHPIGRIFESALNDCERGSLERALDLMSERMQDADFFEISFTVDKAMYFGTELASTLMGLANQMRLKRRQWGEKLASEAEVNMLYPGFIVMIACMLIIVSPFILMFLSENNFL